MSLVGLQGQGSFLAHDVTAVQPEDKGGLLSVLVSTQSRHLTTIAFNSVTNDFAVCDSHGQVFHFRMDSNKYQLVRLGGSSAVTSMAFLHSKLNYLTLAYEDGTIVIVDLQKREAVASMHTVHGNPIRMLRCHPKHSLLVALGVDPNNPGSGRTLDLYDMKTMGVAGSMNVEEDVMDIKFVSIKNAQGKQSTYIAVLLETSGVVFYNCKDLSQALTCPFPRTERMPKWTSFAILPAVSDSASPWGEDGEEEVPAFRFVTAGANSSMYLWESPTIEEIGEYAEDGITGFCSIGGVIEMPVNVKEATFMNTLGDAGLNNDTYRLHVVSNAGTGLVVDISGLAHRTFGVNGMWTVVSDLADSTVVGSAVARLGGNRKGAKSSSSSNMGGRAVPNPAAIVAVASTSDENFAPNSSSSSSGGGGGGKGSIRVDGVVAGASFTYGVVCKDGAVRLFDSDYGVGFGANAGLVLAAREVHGDEARVPIMRYTLTNKTGVAAAALDSKPKIAVRGQTGIRHGGARAAVQKEVKTRASQVKGNANVEHAKEAKELENKKSNLNATLKSRELRKAEHSAKAAAKAKLAEKRMNEAKETVRKSKLVEKTQTRRNNTKLSAAQELEQARRKGGGGNEEKGEEDGLDLDFKAAARYGKEGACVADMVFDVNQEKRVTDAKLKSVLKLHGEFPERHRTLIWRILLKLPENTEAFADLTRRGVHPAFRDLAKRYPLRSRRIFARLQSTCSQLAHWAPILSSAPYLPQIVFPFVVVFGNDELAALEAAMTVMMWWGHSWQVTFPNSPVHIMDCVDTLIYSQQPIVYQHLVDIGMSPGVLGWGMISTLYTEVLSRHDWLKLMDFMFLHIKRVGSPMLVPVAIITCLRTALIRCHTEEDVMTLLRTQQRIDMTALLKTLTNSIRDTNPRYLSAMATGRSANEEDFSDDISIGTRATNATRASRTSRMSMASSRQGSQSGAGYKMSEVEEALESMALAGGAPMFPLYKGRYPSYDILPESVVDWQLRDRHQAIVANQASGAGPSEDSLAMLNSRLEQVQDDHKDLMMSEDRFARGELARRQTHADVEKRQLLELQRIEEEISNARLQSSQRQERATEESLMNIDAGASEARELLQLSEVQMQQKNELQMKVAAQRELAEKIEQETQLKIEQLLARRVREEYERKMNSSVQHRTDEIGAREQVMLQANALQEEQLRLRAFERSRRVTHEKETMEMSRTNEAVISRLQELLLDRESKTADLERQRAVRIATENTMDGMSAAEQASGYVQDMLQAQALARDAELAQMRSQQVAGAYGSVLGDIRKDADKRREQEHQAALEAGKQRKTVEFSSATVGSGGGSGSSSSSSSSSSRETVVSSEYTPSSVSSSSSSSSSSGGGGGAHSNEDDDADADADNNENSLDDILDPLGPIVKLEVKAKSRAGGGPAVVASASASAPASTNPVMSRAAPTGSSSDSTYSDSGSSSSSSGSN